VGPVDPWTRGALDSFEHLFDTLSMTALSPDVTAALATLRTRWGAAAPARSGERRDVGPGDVGRRDVGRRDVGRRDLGRGDARVGEVVGALATVPLEVPDDAAEIDGWPSGRPDPAEIDGWPSGRPDPAKVFSTGFPALDAILGPGGLTRGMGVSLRGDLSSGRTTIVLRLVAEAQAAGSIVAWLDLAAAFDPVEALARGVKPEWLVVVTPADVHEGISIAGALLSGRTVDLLVIDLPQRIDDDAKVVDRLGRLGALARRAGISLAVLEPSGLASSLAGAISEATGVRLELARRSWIRLGRDVVGQRTEVVVARNRAGPPGRRATLRILYADGGERDTCLRRNELLSEAPLIAPVIPVPGKRTDATPPPLQTAPPPRSREAAPALRLVAGGSDRPRGPALDRPDGSRRRSERSGARNSTRDATRVGSPVGPGGNLPRTRTGG
jgi:hypothetical protein